MGRAVRTVGWVGLTTSVVVVVALAVVLVSHRRDESVYIDYVEAYGDYRGHGAALGQAELEAVIEAGERACAWLAHRPIAGLRTGRQFEIGTLQSIYRRQISEADQTLPSSFLPGAWAYLCPGTAELVRPHTPFRDTTAD